jgi:hypothetical protein
MWTVFCAMLVVAGDPRSVDGVGVVDDADARLGRGQPTVAVGLLLRHARQGELAAGERRRAAAVLAKAADALAGAGEVKGAAVAADAAFTLDPEGSQRPTLARHVLAYARAIVDDDEAGARALAERAVAIDSDYGEAVAFASGLAGTDSWISGHLTLGAGLGLWITSVTGLVVAADRERLLRSGGDDVDALERDVATGVMWGAAAAAAVTSGIGLALIFAHDPGPDPVWPHPFPALPSMTAAPSTPTRTLP